MKLHANNRLLAEHLLATAFAILRNEALGPAGSMAAAYRLLTDGIDIAPNQQVELHDYLRQVLADYDSQLPAAAAGSDRQDSRGDAL
jgi:hypothetical protein